MRHIYFPTRLSKDLRKNMLKIEMQKKKNSFFTISSLEYKFHCTTNHNSLTDVSSHWIISTIAPLIPSQFISVFLSLIVAKFSKKKNFFFSFSFNKRVNNFAKLVFPQNFVNAQNNRKQSPYQFFFSSDNIYGRFCFFNFSFFFAKSKPISI